MMAAIIIYITVSVVVKEIILSLEPIKNMGFVYFRTFVITF
jgi:hypothetical protein